MRSPICILGDSITAGVVYSPERERYIHFKDSFINMAQEKLGLDVRNNSKFGQTVGAAMRKVERFAKDISASEHTIIMLGGNDSDFDWPSVADSPDDFHDCNTPLADFVEGYNAFIDKVVELGSKPIIMNLIPAYGRAYYNWICKKCDPEAIMKFLGTPESIEHWNEMYSTAVMKLSAKRSIPLLDVRSPFLKSRFYEGLFSCDGIHPSEDGHKLIYNYLLPQLDNVLV